MCINYHWKFFLKDDSSITTLSEFISKLSKNKTRRKKEREKKLEKKKRGEKREENTRILSRPLIFNLDILGQLMLDMFHDSRWLIRLDTNTESESL
jgi:hypothetical protein